MALIGYARVSTEDQATASQRSELQAAGCQIIYEDKASGASRDRPQLARALARAAAGDTLVVVRIDRLARSLSHLLQIVEALRVRGAYFRSLRDPIDTSSPQGMLMTQMLGAFAEFERALIRERTKAGIQAAVARGKQPGNPKMRARDPIAIRMMKATLADRYLEGLLATKDKWLPTVERLRPMFPWGMVLRQLRARDIGRTFSERTLAKACRTLVAHGYADAGILERASPLPADDRVARLLADRLQTEPGATLRRLAAWLSRDLREPTPRGGFNWSPEGVRREIVKAEKLGLLPKIVRRADPTEV